MELKARNCIKYCDKVCHFFFLISSIITLFPCCCPYPKKVPFYLSSLCGRSPFLPRTNTETRPITPPPIAAPANCAPSTDMVAPAMIAKEPMITAQTCPVLASLYSLLTIICSILRRCPVSCSAIVMIRFAASGVT